MWEGSNFSFKGCVPSTCKLPDLQWTTWFILLKVIFQYYQRLPGLRISGSSTWEVGLENNVQVSKNIKTTFGSIVLDLRKISISFLSSFRNIIVWIKVSSRQARQMNASLWLVNRKVNKMKRSFYLWAIYWFQLVYNSI